MKNNLTIITVLVAVMLQFSSVNNVTAQEIKIGTQTWSTTNLDVATFRNGDAIPEAKTDAEWKRAAHEGAPAWCYYDNDPANGKKYGKLYNWYAVNDKRGLAPEGWHVPSDPEWIMLTGYLGGENVAGTKMKSKKGWEKSGSNSTNTSGFAGLPGGYRYEAGSFDYIGSYGYWWSATDTNSENRYAFMCSLDYDNGSALKGTKGKRDGISVRCLKD